MGRDILTRAFGLTFTDEYCGSWNGIRVSTDRRLKDGTVEFRDQKGDVIGVIENIGGITIGPQS